MKRAGKHLIMFALMLALVLMDGVSAVHVTASAETNDKIVYTSKIYAGEVSVDGEPRLKYLYSPDISVHYVVFENLKSALTGTGLQDMVPNISQEEENQNYSGFFHFTGSPQKGIEYLADQDYFNGINEDWSSVSSVAERCFSGTVGTETTGKLITSSEDPVGDSGMHKTGKLFEKEGNRVFYSTLSIAFVDVWVEENGVLKKETISTLNNEETQVIYTTVNVTTTEKAAVKKTPTANSLTYKGSAQALVTAGEAEGGTMQYALGTDATNAPAADKFTTSIPTATDAGTYYVWYKVKGDDNHLDTDPVCIESTIRGVIQYTVTFKVVNGSWDEGEGDAATDDKTVTLTGAEGDTLKLAEDQIPAVGTKPNDTYKAGGWDVTPSTETAITEAITYTYTYAQKDAAAVTTAPTANTLTYNGSAQALATAGTASGGTMQYALGTDATTAPTTGYTTSIPTATDAGTYYVWYKVVGDDNHSSTEPVCIVVVIAPENAAYTAVSIVGDSADSASHKIGSWKGVTITVKRSLRDEKTYQNFASVVIDGTTVKAENYETAQGSLILTFKADYLDTLAVGERKVTIAFTDGSAEAKLTILAKDEPDPTATPTTTPTATPAVTPTAKPTPTATPKDIPKTGDSGNPALWALLVLTGLGLSMLVMRKKSPGKRK